jgi:hypothetical protein
VQSFRERNKSSTVDKPITPTADHVGSISSRHRSSDWRLSSFVFFINLYKQVSDVHFGAGDRQARHVAVITRHQILAD